MYSLVARYYFLHVTTRVSLPHFHGFLILSTPFSETFASRASGRTSCYPANIIPGHSSICEMYSNFLYLRTHWPSGGPNGSLSIFNVIPAVEQANRYSLRTVQAPDSFLRPQISIKCTFRSRASPRTSYWQPRGAWRYVDNCYG